MSDPVEILALISAAACAVREGRFPRARIERAVGWALTATQEPAQLTRAAFYRRTFVLQELGVADAVKRYGPPPAE